jgi:excisionase family DNA binding protein
MVTKELRPGDVLTINAAAKELGVRNVTVWRWTQSGKASFVMFGGQIFIPVSEVQRLKREQNNKRAVSSPP